jgi:glycosyltransferase involved in cell wall biosynthesis
LNRESKVLAIVPYFQCRPWLEQCLGSLVGQTRPLEGIVVVDDHTGDPPVDIVEKFKQVTLWRSPENVGPYRLIQSVMEATQYDAYLFQDADDWSSIDRLERLLAEGERTGAELIGTQELMYLSENLFPNAYPLDANLALQESYGYALLHPSSLVSR